MLGKDNYRPRRPSRFCEQITLRCGGDARHHDHEVCTPNTPFPSSIQKISHRHEPTLNGVVLAHSDVHFLDRVARLQADSPFAICHVGFDALIWKPTRGMELSACLHRALLRAPSYYNSSRERGLSPFSLSRTDQWLITPAGRVTLCSPDHVSLLVHRTFNVSIPRHHIPTDHWEFEYGPAENDPEFGNVDDDMDPDATADVQGDDAQATTDQRGRWVHRITGDRLGGKDRCLRFTVVGWALF